MVSLQPKLNLKVSQRQILTPGLMQMVSVLALNKLELKDMIQAEIAENPVLEELEESVPMLDHVADPGAEAKPEERDKPDPFEEIDFGSYFQEYLDPGFRSPQSFEVNEKPSLENYLSAPGSLADHLCWQLGSLPLLPAVRDAAEYIVGNLDDDGYLTATDEELLAGYMAQLASQPHAAAALADAQSILAQSVAIVQGLDPVGIGARDLRDCLLVQVRAARAEWSAQERKRDQVRRQAEDDQDHEQRHHSAFHPSHDPFRDPVRDQFHADDAERLTASLLNVVYPDTHISTNGHQASPAQAHLRSARENHLNGQAKLESPAHDSAPVDNESAPPVHEQHAVFDRAERIIDKQLSLLLKRDLRELAKAIGATVEQSTTAFEFIRTLDPRPGNRFNPVDTRLIEPDVAFVKRDDEYIAVMDDESVPTLRLNQGYRRLMKQPSAEKDVKDYVKERYRSALQLMRNIEQRKNTILRTCEVIVRRQQDFLERGVEALRPMMIKEVAEEIGVHPSTVSRAVSNKYVHTPQGVFELRFFFSEGVNGPEGSGTPLLLLKRKVKKLIEEEDPRKPLTDDRITEMLQAQGIDVTRRTVAKYREDLRIPSTHQRRIRH